MNYVIRKAHFNAAHRLHNPDKSDQWNREIYGKCNHPNWHGHNYLLEVVVAGNPDPETGYVIDLGILQALIEQEVIEPCDHKNLNTDVSYLSGIIPTSENLARVFYERLRDPVEAAAADGARLHAVRLHETNRNSAEYRPD
ncbi:MAG: 6-carboxytetrahydropterin synthase [Balneolaceae bacterium]